MPRTEGFLGSWTFSVKTRKVQVTYPVWWGGGPDSRTRPGQSAHPPSTLLCSPQALLPKGVCTGPGFDIRQSSLKNPCPSLNDYLSLSFHLFAPQLPCF